MAFDTAVNILNDAAVELGLYSTDLADPYDSTDANIIRLCRLLKSVGQEIRDERSWTWLQKTATITTVASTVGYALPTDFAAMIPSTHWNRSTSFPMGGPLSPQEWQYLQANANTSSFTVMFRPVNGEVQLSPTPSSVQTLAYEYKSSSWVDRGGGTNPEHDSPTDGADTIFLPRLLVVRGLKRGYLRQTGFPSDAADQDYQDTLRSEASKDSVGKVLSLGGHRGLRAIDGGNIPDTGVGA